MTELRANSGLGEFGHLTALVASSDWIVAADGLEQSLRLLDAGDDAIGRWGRQGQGPAEFVDISALARYGSDSIVVHDAMMARLTVISVRDRGHRTLPAPAFRGSYLRGVIEDSLFVLFGGNATNRGFAASDAYWDSSSVVILSTNGDHADTVGRLPYRYRAAGNSQRFMLLESHGKVVANGDRYCFANTTVTTATCYDRRGARMAEMSWSQPRRVVTEDLKADYADYYLAEAARIAPEEWLKQRMEDVIWPDTLPAVGDIILDDRSRLWVEEYRLPNERAPHVWRVFAPDGALTATVNVPGPFDPMTVVGDTVWGIWTDSLDLTTIRAYLLDQRERPVP